jgi:hypothetical protein
MWVGRLSRAIVRMTIDDAEHYTPEQRAAIIASYPAHEREARAKGIPTLGSGRVYPVSDDEIAEDLPEIPRHWAVIGGIDFGWDHPTAAVKIAWDRDADCVHVVNAYRKSQEVPLFHVAALLPWGKDLPWAWPHDGSNTIVKDGTTLADSYRGSGLKMLFERATHEDGSNGVEAGVLEILERMQSGRFKVARHLNEWFDEFRLYHRKDGKIVKERDDLMDATRYAVMMLRFAVAQKSRPKDAWADGYGSGSRSNSWMTA